MEQREKRYIKTALTIIPHGTSVLNWPCGHGQLLPFLKQLGYKVTSADSSSYAVMQARLYGGLLGENCIDDTDDFQVVNIFKTGFDDDYFGAVVVNHLFYRFPEPQMRQRIFKELQRICSGPIIVTFFYNTMIYEIARFEKQKPHEHGTQHRFCFNRKSFAEEVRKCGLIVGRWIPRYGLVSRQACAVLVQE